MWTKDFSTCLIAAVYQRLFSIEVDKSLTFGWSLVLEELSQAGKDPPDVGALDASLRKLEDNQAKYQEQLEKYLQSWERTYDVVKAVLLVFLQELSEQSENLTEETLSTIINKYVRLTQDYIGGENTSLVHAVAKNIVERDLGEFIASV